MPVHTRLYLLRMKHKLSQQAMADIAGCAKSTYKNYEYGLRIPPAAVILSIATQLEEDPGGIMFGEKKMKALTESQANELVRQIDAIASHDKILFAAIKEKISEYYESLPATRPMKNK